MISLGSVADADAAVAAAKAALPAWAATPPAERRAIIARILDQYEARKEEFAQAISMEMGAPIDFALAEQASCLPWHTKNFLRAFDQIEWIKPLGDHAPGAMIALEPIGVVGLITPWNWPVNQIALKAIPAMLAGCTCVLKPSEESPLNAMMFAEFCHDAGVPAGVFNLVNGDGMGVGSAPVGTSRCRDDFLHRLDTGRQGDFQGRRRDAEARDAGTGRQGRERAVCGCG